MNQAIRELHQEVEEHSGYERIEGFHCLPTKGENTLVGSYTNNTDEYEDFAREVIMELAAENRKEKRTIEELVEIVEKARKLFITIEYVKTFPTCGGKFAKPVKKVYLFITKQAS